MGFNDYPGMWQVYFDRSGKIHPVHPRAVSALRCGKRFSIASDNIMLIPIYTDDSPATRKRLADVARSYRTCVACARHYLVGATLGGLRRIQ